jgi:hypothetical protein
MVSVACFRHGLPNPGSPVESVAPTQSCSATYVPVMANNVRALPDVVHGSARGRGGGYDELISWQPGVPRD